MEKKRMENKMQDSERNRKDFLMDMVKRVYSDDMNLIDLDRELVDKLDDFIASEISKAREEGRKEGDIASDFLYWHPLVGGMPDSSIRIGVEFEVGGCYEDWGFVIEQYGKTISSGRTLKEAISKLTTK